MKVTPTALPEVLTIEPRVFGDQRGWFFETWQQARYAEAGLPAQFLQDNVSSSQRGVLRGLHYQWPHPQGKLISVLQGKVFDVAVDIRRGSPRFGRWVGCEMSADNHRQLYVPPGFAHGFVVLSEQVLFSYKCTDLYRPECEGSILWDDPAIGIDWPSRDVQLSAKDQAGIRLADMPAERLPVYGEV